jgi:hypothetical protein
VLVALADGDDWVFHRGGGKLRRALTDITSVSPGGLAYLRPELVLLFKARDGRDKDDRDFCDLLPLLTPGQKAWLLPRLARAGGPEHPWARLLAGG